MSFLPFPPHVSPSTAAPYGYSHPPRRSASLPAAPEWPWAVASCSRLCSDPNPHGPTAPRNFQSLDAVATQEEPVQCKIDTNWLVVSTHLKNISQIGNLPPGRGENKKYLRPPPSKLPVVSSCKLGKKIKLHFFWRLEFIGPQSKLIIKEFRVWNALTWSLTLGLWNDRYHWWGGGEFLIQLGKRKTYPSTNPATPPENTSNLGDFCHPKVNFFELPKNCLKNVSRNIQRDPTVSGAPINLSIYKK